MHSVNRDYGNGLWGEHFRLHRGSGGAGGGAGLLGGPGAVPAAGRLRPDAGPAGAGLARRTRPRAEALERIAAEPWVEAVSSERRRGAAAPRRRLDRARPARALESGEGIDAANGDLAAGERYAVYFWGANTTKALHIGHLRNLAIGNAIGAALAAGRRPGRAPQPDLRRRPQHGRGDGRGRRQRRRPARLGPRATRRATTSSAPATPTTSRPSRNGGGGERRRRRGLGRPRVLDVQRQSRRADDARARRRPAGARTVVEDARLGDLRPAQDAGPARRRLRQGDLRVRLPARGRRADQPRASARAP